MALTAGVNSYGTQAEANSYQAERQNLLWGALGGAVKDRHLIMAHDWLERTFRYVGRKATDAQTSAWPRTEAYDNIDDYIITGTPEAIKEAQFIVADLFRDGTFDMEGIVNDSVGAVKREKVDVLETEWDTSRRTRGPDVLTHVYQLVSPYVLASGQLLRV
jgi:hypothetical protein